MQKTKILVLGNDPQINDINFDRLDPHVITYGVNRIWLKHIPHYLFFHDLPVLTELYENQEALVKVKAQSKVFTSDWLMIQNKGLSIPKWISIYPRVNRYQFVDSVTTGLQILTKNLYSTRNVRFYIAGVSLFWREPSHFWKELNHSSTNTRGPAWYEPRFERIYNNFVNLKVKKFDIVSVNPNSSLNKLFRYENIANLYRK